VSRPTLEVADIFRDHGAAWRSANAGHVSLDKLKVMSAIERCRTAALGGHVAACADCDHIHVAYNSCRNRHCPKCQGAAAKDWLAARQTELLDVPYFHVVFTVPKPIADIAYQNKSVVYDILLKAGAETLITIAADPKHLGARIGFTGVLHTWGSAMTHHPHVHWIVPGGGISPDGERWIACRPRFFLHVRVLSRRFRRRFLEKLRAAHRAGRLRFFNDLALLAERRAFSRYLAPWHKAEWVVYAKPPAAGPDAVLAYLSRYTHPLPGSGLHRKPREGRCHLKQPPDRPQRQPGHLQVERLPRKRPLPAEDHEARNTRIHSPLPEPRSAQGFSSHPPLRPARQRQSRRDPGPSTSTARHATARGRL
jgi:hypothetical protein